MGTKLYGYPIVLEDCPDPNVLLGFHLSQKQGRLSVQYIVLPERWRYTHPQGAGSKHRLMTGLHSRASSAVAFSFFLQQTKEASTLLSKAYIALGFDFKTVRGIIQKYCRIDSGILAP